MALWGGRFSGKADPLFRRFNDSLPFDWRLAAQDVRGSIAWAGAIHRAGVLKRTEHGWLVAGLRKIGGKTAKMTGADFVASGQEDVHSWVESELIGLVGPLGKKLHTGRSRNDQVATDLRLWTRDAIDARLGELGACRAALVRFADREQKTVLPGYTHLQRAQPILFGHWAMAYEQMLSRDAARLADARGRVNVCPLGSAALAGTTFKIDRARLARELGFDAPTANSLDATADRDFVIETLGACALAAVHLSRLAEDMILYATSEFGFLELSDAVTSGSSLMPQKKNPDALELIRGKTGRIIGAHTSLSVTLKGLPLAYNKDLQEDKEPLFDAMEQLSLCLQMLPIVLDGAVVNRERCRDAALGGYTNATELADYLVGKGMPFREAHEVVGRIVRHALGSGSRLEDVPLAAMRGFSGLIDKGVYRALRIESGLKRREVFGGTGPRQVRAAIGAARRKQ